MSSDRARELRRLATDAERKLWRLLRNRQIDGIKFRRQRPIGRYIVDFAAIERNLIIELDSGQHAASTDADRVRTQRLSVMGFRAIRFWNNHVLLNSEEVILEIRKALAPDTK